MASSETSYRGGELELFSLAANWKKYIKAQIEEYLTGDVLEVGAGIGGTTKALHDGTARSWVCLEPDRNQAQQIRSTWIAPLRASEVHVVVSSLRALADRPLFDCVLYIDVLEHVPDDRREIQQAARLVRCGGHIVVLSPAHQWLFSEFDRRIGHLRRYSKRSLQSLMPLGWFSRKLEYLDCIGVLLSLGNVLALRRAMPSPVQLRIWDRHCIPLSRRLDRLLMGKLGKSVLAVWGKGCRRDERIDDGAESRF